jgi:hypothetical protein
MVNLNLCKSQFKGERGGGERRATNGPRLCVGAGAPTPAAARANAEAIRSVSPRLLIARAAAEVLPHIQPRSEQPARFALAMVAAEVTRL